MGGLLQTNTHAGEETKGELWGLEGNLYLPLVMALFVGVGISCLLITGGATSLIGAICAPAIVLTPLFFWAVVLKNRKPKGYDIDFIESSLGEGNRPLNTSQYPQAFQNIHPKMNHSHKSEPEGFFIQDLMVFGNLDKGTTVSKGFELVFPDLQACTYEKLNTLHDKISNLLVVLSERYKLQVHWYTTADYRNELLRYKAETDKAKDLNTQEYRHEIFCRLWEQMQRGELRKEKLVLFISKQLTEKLPLVVQTQESYYAKLLSQLELEFTTTAAELQTILGNEVEIKLLNDLEHYIFAKCYCNPHLIGEPEEHFKSTFVPQASIQQNCLLSEFSAQAEGALFIDPMYLSAITLQRWPQRTFPGIITYLTNLPISNYRIVVNSQPLDKRKEVKKEQKEIDRLKGEYAEKGKHALTVAIQKKETKIESLSSGTTSPFSVDFMIYVWGKTVEELQNNKNLLRNAIANMNGAEGATATLPSSLRRLFALGFPGWTNSSYKHRSIYAEDSYLADMLPFSSTFTGYLEAAEALYVGSKNNLVGLRTFLNGTPQHTVLIGMTGAGKSIHMEDILRQTEHYYDYTLIIEEGLSYGKFTQARGAQPIIVHPDSELTLNYLDTQGMPLTSLQLTMAVSLLTKMVGEGNDRRENALRQAQLAQYINRLYEDIFQDWALRNSSKLIEIKRLACATEKWRQEKLPLGSTFIEAWTDLRDRLANHEDEAEAFCAAISEQTITKFEKEPETEKKVISVAYAYFKKEQCPTHRMLVELMLAYQFPEHKKEEIHKAAVLLSAWTASGQYGKLFDGVSNVNLKGKIAHFELGYIPEEAMELKVAAGLLVTGFARQHIITLPRKLWKRILFEEIARFLDVPGGEKIVAEAYAQLRKFNCWTASIVQQYSKFRSTKIRPVIMGNSKQFFLMRQFDRGDIEDIAQDIGLPETAQEQIMSYSLPEQLPDTGKFSSICYYAPGAQQPFCGTIRNYKSAQITS
jgi:type IV secretory pathway VirB4 component